MPGHIYTIEELMLDDSFINYCLSTGAAVPSEWRTTIRDNPEQEKTFEEAKRLVLSLHGGLSRPEINRQIEIVRKQLQGRANEAPQEKTEATPVLSTAFVITGKGEIKRKLVKRFFAYVTVICLIGTAGWWFLFKQAGHSAGTETIPQVLAHQSPLGQRQTVNLPDGSTAILNSNSSLYINDDFNKKVREVHLSGDAFFKVAKNAERPFIVYTGNIATTALGTEFYVHGGKGTSKNIQVDLLEGKVKMADTSLIWPDTPIILLPGESGKSIEGSNLVKQSFDSLYLRNWIKGRIIFNETPVLKALKQLESWYSIEIKVNRKGLKDRLISGEYQDKSLQDVLKIICFSINSRYSITNNHVIIE